MKIKREDRYGLIGESTCGKTTLGKLIAFLIPKADSGYIRFDNDNRSIFEYTRKEARQYRKRVQMIFQNPDASLNPGMRIRSSIAEAINACPKNKRPRKEVQELVKEYLHQIKLADRADNYPDILSGGEKRRVSVIRALALEPDLIVADEPFSSLDASLRNEILDLFLAQTHEISYLFILHDLDIAKYVCDTIAVMYLGRLVETGQSHEILTAKAVKHPYTEIVYSAQTRLKSPPGEDSEDWHISQLPSIPQEGGCAFRNRCILYSRKLDTKQKQRCQTEVPALELVDGSHRIACHFRS